jgi:hypothetical protein
MNSSGMFPSADCRIPVVRAEAVPELLSRLADQRRQPGQRHGTDGEHDEVVGADGIEDDGRHRGDGGEGGRDAGGWTQRAWIHPGIMHAGV